MYNKRLDDEQLHKLISKSGSCNPLWLTLACEELRVFGSFENLLGKIESLPDDLIECVLCFFILNSHFKHITVCIFLD